MASSWQVKLLIDKQERNKSSEFSHERLKHELGRHGEVPCETRTLPAGDYIWIATNGHKERVLGVVIERKAYSDLERTMKEKALRYPPKTRMDVQMAQMSYSGIEEQIYILEDSKNDVVSDRSSTAFSFHEKARTLLKQHGFQVYETPSFAQTVEFLKHKHHEVLQKLELPPPGYLPTLTEVCRNVKSGLKQLKAECNELRDIRVSCGKKMTCECYKARFDQSCKLCFRRIRQGDCVVNPDQRGWQHVKCPIDG